MSEKSIHKLAAIVFTDIVGYTKRMEQSEDHTMLLLKQQREIIFPVVEKFGGEVIKEIGDGLLMMFSSAIQAVRFTIEIQERLKESELTIRAGIHIGDVIFEGKDVFGSAVNTAARIEPLAPSGGICISEDVRNQIKNKEDIRTISIGKKKLKNVKEPLEIFRIVLAGEQAEADTGQVSFLGDLWKRKVIQLLLAYLVFSGLVKYFIGYVSEVNSLSPHLEQLSWVIMLSLLPAVFILTYYRSGKKQEGMTKTEMIGLPANLIITVLLSILLFHGKDLGATTKTITLENENGDTIERVVPKNEFRKKIAIFFLGNDTGDTAFDWLSYGMAILLEYDLSQDLYMDINTGFSFKNKMQKAGFETGLGLPLTLMQRISEYYHKEFFLSGSFSKTGEQFTITTRLYETENGKLLSEDNYTGNNLFILTDEISTGIKKNTNLPSDHIEKTMDFPVSEIFTDEFDALEYYVKGYKAAFLNNDFSEAVDMLEKSVEADTAFALAHFYLANIYFNNNDAEKALISLESAKKNIFKLPERVQYQTKFFDYLIRQEPEKAMSVIKMWVELFPDDLEGRKTLAERLKYKNLFSESIEQYKAILDIDPDQGNVLLEIGELYTASEMFDSALHYYREYTERFPQDYSGYFNLGDFYYTTANYEKARTNLEKALLLDPENISIQVKLGGIDMRTGDLANALLTFNTALETSKNHLDKYICLNALSSYYELLGQKRKSLALFKEMSAEGELSLNPLRVQVAKVFNISKYIIAGNSDEAFEVLKQIENDFDPPVDKVASYGYLFAYLELEDAENARKMIPVAEQVAKGFGEEMLLANITYALGRIFEIENDYKSALDQYLEFLRLQPTAYTVNMRIAKCYRMMGQLKKAEEFVLKALKNFPFHPEINFEASLIYFEKGEEAKGMEHLDRALDIWSDADPDYKPAMEANAKLLEMRTAG